jgi:hypothetical protein
VNLNQVVNINKALEAGGSGVQLSGFNFGFTAKNGNGWDNGSQDYLSAYVKFYNAAGGVAATYDYTNQTNKKYNWTNFNFSETFANPIAASNYSNAQVGFVGRDNNFWVGPYGPEITNVSFSLKYRVDPCSTNPAYSPSCAGFGNIVTSGNLLNSNLMSNGNVVYNSFAINTALKSSGAGVEVYGFNYGYNYSLGDATKTNECVSWTNAFTCGAYLTTNPTAQVRVRLTDSSNKEIYSAVQSKSTPNTAENVSYQFLLTSTTNSLSLGTFIMGAHTSGNAAIQNMYANALYKPDPCVTNPLYSSTCPGYATAYAKNMLLGSTVASASAPAAAAPAAAQSAPAEASPSQAQSSPAQAQSSPQQFQSSPSPQQDANQNPSVAQMDPAQPSPTQAGPAPTSPQPAGGPPPTATASSPPPIASPSQSGPQQGGGGAGPSKLAMSVLKTAQANDKATQATAVQQAAKAFEGSQASSQTASNLAISMNQDMSANSATAAAQFSSQTTQSSQQTAVQASQGPQQQQQTSTQQQQTAKVVQQVQQQQEVQQQVQQSTSVVQVQQAAYTPPPQQQEAQSTAVTMLKPLVPATVELPQQTSSGTGLTISRNPFGYNPLSSFNLSSIISAPAQTAPVYQPRLQERIMEIEALQIQVASFGGLGRAGNPLSEMMMQQRFEMMQENVQQQTSSVNRNVQPNDLAAGVDLASMALQPKGFEAYSFTLRDAAFYEPKEVYKGQTVIDNARALRQLSSDRLHKEMVDQQYK